MKWVFTLLIVIIGYLQYRVWFGEGSMEQITQLQREIEKQKIENAGLHERNRALSAEIKELKEGTESIEAKARMDMGMIKEGETFYFIPEIPSAPFNVKPVPNPSNPPANKTAPKKP
jgi:cell division protein FtsB